MWQVILVKGWSSEAFITKEYPVACAECSFPLQEDYKLAKRYCSDAVYVEQDEFSTQSGTEIILLVPDCSL